MPIADEEYAEGPNCMVMRSCTLTLTSVRARQSLQKQRLNVVPLARRPPDVCRLTVQSLNEAGQIAPS